MDKSTITLERMRTFVRVAERGNLSAVARELEVGQSTITRHLRELEEALETALLSRTTRRVSLTDEGSRYYDHCIQILALVEQANEQILDNKNAPSGIIRVSCTAALGVRHITGLIFKFQSLYPDIRIDLSFTDERIDLVKEGVDIALRLGPLADSSMKLRRIGESRRILVASSNYLSTHGKPTKPKDLIGQNVIRMSNIVGSNIITCVDENNDQQTISVTGTLLVDHGLAAREAFKAGVGMGLTHLWLVDDLVKSGQLEILLPQYSFPTTPLNMLIVPERANVARVRLLIDYLIEKVGKLPGIES